MRRVVSLTLLSIATILSLSRPSPRSVIAPCAPERLAPYPRSVRGEATQAVPRIRPLNESGIHHGPERCDPTEPHANSDARPTPGRQPSRRAVTRTRWRRRRAD